ncbi:hypothetical protein FAGKG844_1180002 [Frankia sp. AgKG'84/4]
MWGILRIPPPLPYSGSAAGTDLPSALG